jgi:hypothetical protein
MRACFCRERLALYWCHNNIVIDDTIDVRERDDMRANPIPLAKTTLAVGAEGDLRGLCRRQ